METLLLRNSDLLVSRLCFGGDPMGGHGWGHVAREELILAVRTALETGINFFDTADIYGLGESERILGEALGRRRHEAIIATKFGVRRTSDGRTYYDNASAWIRKAILGSLERLNTDYVDLYQVHYRDGHTSVDEIVETLDQLKQEGLIRHYGLSNVFVADMEELLPHKGKFVSFQNEYSLANRRNEHDILSLSQALEMNPLTWGSLGQGILTGKYDASTKFDVGDRRSRPVYRNFHGEGLLKSLEIVDAMRGIAEAHGKSLASVAIRFILDYLPESVVIAGVKSRKQLVSNAEALEWSLGPSDISALEMISRE